MTNTSPGRGPVHICLADTRAPARLLIRQSVPGVAIALPLLIVDPCPFALYQGHGLPHAHIHTLCDPRPAPWYKVPPCCREPYLVYVAAA